MERVVEIAKVTDTKDPLALGRVKVKLLAFSIQPEMWLRQMLPYATATGGAVFLPEVDDEVLVLRGGGDDPNRMFVIGALYNGGANKTLYSNADGDNITKQIQTKAGNKIVYTDKSGEEGILLQTKAGTKIELTDKSAVTGIGITTSDGTITFKLDKNGAALTVANAKTCKVTVDGDVTVKSNQGNVTVDGAMNVDVKAGTNLTVKGGANATLEAGAQLEVKGGAGVKVSAPMVEVSGSLVKIN